MNRFLLIIIVLYLLLSPFYFFSSGLPQISDFIVAFGVFIFLFSKDFKVVLKDQILKYLFLFLGVVILVNFSAYIYYLGFKGIPNNIFFASFFYIFNAFFFSIFLFIFSNNHSKNFNSNVISLFILVSLFIQTSLAILGIEGSGEEIGSRPSIFFNNPNQLGYFSLLMLSIFTVVPSYFRKNIITIILAIFLTTYLILYSGSRAALAGVLLLSVLLFILEGFKVNLKSMFFLFLLILSSNFFLNSNFVNEKLEFIDARNQRHQNTNISEAQIRGYDRIWIHPEYVFFGAGEGLNERFDSYQRGEMHSGIGIILFSYGLLGTVFFILFIKKIIENNIFLNLIIISPILVYNITHHGLRSSLFWGFLATIYLSTSKIKK